MKLRIKFSKNGIMKFIGHLDVMRYFQKANRRAGIDIAYSAGFSPHQIMSFAAPLGLGLTSDGEYVDMEVKTALSSEEMIRKWNAVMVEGIRVEKCVLLPEQAKAAMSIVAAADYRLTRNEACRALSEDWLLKLSAFLSQEQILTIKKTKKSEKEIDLKPFIYEWHPEENGIFVKLASGSVSNLKPELLLNAFFESFGQTYEEHYFSIHRLELYAWEGEEGSNLIPLEKWEAKWNNGGSQMNKVVITTVQESL